MARQKPSITRIQANEAAKKLASSNPKLSYTQALAQVAKDAGFKNIHHMQSSHLPAPQASNSSSTHKTAVTKAFKASDGSSDELSPPVRRMTSDEWPLPATDAYEEGQLRWLMAEIEAAAWGVPSPTKDRRDIPINGIFRASNLIRVSEAQPKGLHDPLVKIAAAAGAKVTALSADDFASPAGEAAIAAFGKDGEDEDGRALRGILVVRADMLSDRLKKWMGTANDAVTAIIQILDARIGDRRDFPKGVAVIVIGRIPADNIDPDVLSEFHSGIMAAIEKTNDLADELFGPGHKDVVIISDEPTAYRLVDGIYLEQPLRHKPEILKPTLDLLLEKAGSAPKPTEETDISEEGQAEGKDGSHGD